MGAVQHMSTGVAPSKSQVVHFLDNREDPEVDSAIRAYQKAAFSATKAAPEKAEETLELTAQVQRKYVAAQIVESGIQNVTVPLSATTTAPVLRYVQQLQSLGSKAGFESPVAEVTKRIREKSAGAQTAKELLTEIKPLASPDYHAALVEALAAVEAETNSSVTLDGSSAGYKKFAERVAKVAEAHKLPVKLLQAAPGDETAAKLAVWVQSAQVADATTELDALRTEATALLDKHLSKTAEQIKKDQAAALATLQRKIDSAKGAAWAVQYAADLKAIADYDAAVAADPVNGPKVAVA